LSAEEIFGGHKFRADRKMKRDVTLCFITQNKDFCQHRTEKLLWHCVS